MDWIISTVLMWVAMAIMLIIVDRLNIGLKVNSFTTAIIAALVIAVTDLILGSILRFVTIPLDWLFLCLLTWLINWVIFAVVIYVSSKIVKGFEIVNFIAALVAAAVMGLISWGIGTLLTQLNL